MTDSKERFTELLAQERKAGDLGLWWLSFADSDLPKGSQFLGVVILEAFGFTDAIDRCNLFELNPGGEVRGYRVEREKHPEHLHNRLLTREELAGIGASTLNSASHGGTCVCGNCNKGA